METLNKAIKFELVNYNLHITVCFLKNIPKKDYESLKKYLEEKNKLWCSEIWTLKFLGQWGNNSDFVTAYNKNGISLEYYRDEIFKEIHKLYEEYIDRSRTKTGLPPSHIDVSKLSSRPTGETWQNISLILK
jgi:hypothetical protein